LSGRAERTPTCPRWSIRGSLRPTCRRTRHADP